MNATLTRLTALGRAELTLLGRNRNNLFIALLMPLLMILVLRSSVTQTAEGVSGGVAGATLVGGTGMVLVLVVYMGLVSAYVARREELVLKRLRTGEAIAEVAYELGYADQSHLTRDVKRLTGYTPAQSQHRDEPV